MIRLLFALFYGSRAQGVPPSLEAPADQAPDSLCDSASPESTSGTCFSAWRTREGPIAHSCSIKASSNSGGIKKRRAGPAVQTFPLGLPLISCSAMAELAEKPFSNMWSKEWERTSEPRPSSQLSRVLQRPPAAHCRFAHAPPPLCTQKKRESVKLSTSGLKSPSTSGR